MTLYDEKPIELYISQIIQDPKTYATDNANRSMLYISQIIQDPKTLYLPMAIFITLYISQIIQDPKTYKYNNILIIKFL